MQKLSDRLRTALLLQKIAKERKGVEEFRAILSSASKISEYFITIFNILISPVPLRAYLAF